MAETQLGELAPRQRRRLIATSLLRSFLTVPIEAIMTAPMASHCVAVRRSSRNTMPVSAATAGSRLIRVPKVVVAS